jgi:signal transduction histidine kinase
MLSRTAESLMATADMSTNGRDPERQLGRSLYALFFLAVATAIAGPVLSYQSDLAEMESLIEARLLRDADLQARALDRYLTLLKDEIVQLARRPEVDQADRQLEAVARLFSAAENDSVLLDTGLSLLDREGRVVWSDRKVSSDATVVGRVPEPLHRLWSGPDPASIVLDPRTHTAVVPVTVVRQGETRGFLLGHVDFSSPHSPILDVVRDVAIFDRAGKIIMPGGDAGDMSGQELDTWVRSRVGTRHAGKLGDDRLAVDVPVGTTGLSLLLSSSRTGGRLHQRFVLQLVLVATVQFSAVLLLTLFARAMYKRYALAERRAREHATLAALGGAASLIAHEVKNSLNGLGAALSLIDLGGDANLAAKTMRGQIDRLRHLATSLLAFGKPQSPRRIPTDIRPLLLESIAALRDLPEADDVAVSLTVGASPRVACDPLFLATALDNLLRNAIEAAATAKDTGKIVTPWVRTSIEASRSEVRIVVDDNAGGLDEEQQSRLFEPFVTTKPKGIGLGLAMAFRAAKDQGGDLVYQRTADGSRFILRLPVQESPEVP